MKSIIIKSMKKIGIGLLYFILIFLLIFDSFKLIKAVIDIKNAEWYRLPYSVIYIMLYIHLIKKVRNRNTPDNKGALYLLIEKELKKHGTNCSLNHINISKVRDLSYLFIDSEFNGDISKWDTSNATQMGAMFWGSKFNGDISQWDTSKVLTMEHMFYKSEFNGDISNWNVSKVINMSCMFLETKFNGDLSKWNVSSVNNMDTMFSRSEFNGDLSNWNVNNVEKMSSMFEGSKFTNDISKWNVSKVVNMNWMFHKSEFNGDLSNWNVISLKDINSIFYDSKFKWYLDGTEDEKYASKPSVLLPYWATYINKEERDHAVLEYLSNKN